MENEVAVVEPTEPVVPTKLYGIEDLWKLLCFVIEGANIAGKLVLPSEEKWYRKYILNFLDIGDELVDLFSIKFAWILPEIKDLDAEEMAELITRAKAKFDIPDDKAEETIEKCFALFLKLGEDVKEIVLLVQSFKK